MSLVLWCTVCAGAYLHALTSLVDNGHVMTTPSYYAVPGILPFLAIVFDGLRSLPRKLAATALAVAGLLFIFTEWYGLLFVAAPFWSNTTVIHTIVSRLASIHPIWLSPSMLPGYAVAYSALLVYVLCGIAGKAPRVSVPIGNRT